MEQVSSIFKQILKFFPRTIFDAAVNQHEAKKHAKGMTCWSQFMALMFCHLGGARSLREIITVQLPPALIPGQTSQLK